MLAGSLVGSNGVFLRALYAAGIKGYYDGLAVHFYTLTLASLRSIHEVQLANGDTKPLWLDEFGWSSCWPRQRIQQEQACVTKQAQAANLANVFRSLARTPYVAAEVVYKLQDSRSEDFGLLTETGAHKPSFAALAERARLAVWRAQPGDPAACAAAAVASWRAARDRSATTCSWKRSSGRVPRYRALFTLDRFNRYSIVLPRALGTNGLRVRVFQYWMGTARAASASI